MTYEGLRIQVNEPVKLTYSEVAAILDCIKMGLDDGLCYEGDTNISRDSNTYNVIESILLKFGMSKDDARYFIYEML